MSRQTGLVFTANALPALSADKAYQLWVIADGKPVSAGLVTPDSSGHAAQLFAMPPNLVAPQAVAVTIEPAGGVSAPTGDKVLVGAVPVATAS
jgi:anti-sigma-K factor RskA